MADIDDFIDNSQLDFQTDAERAIEARIEEFKKMPDMLTLGKDIIFRAIAHEEHKSAAGNKRINLPGLSTVLKLLLDMEGIGQATERDIDLTEQGVDWSGDPGKVVEKLMELRGKGVLKSLQSKDLALLVEKGTELTKVRELVEFMKKAEEEVNKKAASQNMLIQKREDMPSHSNTNIGDDDEEK